MQGVVKRINSERGFGFIRPDSGGRDVFFHCRDLEPSLGFDERLTEQRVEFDTVDDVKGPRAANVRGL